MQHSGKISKPIFQERIEHRQLARVEQKGDVVEKYDHKYDTNAQRKYVALTRQIIKQILLDIRLAVNINHKQRQYQVGHEAEGEGEDDRRHHTLIRLLPQLLGRREQIDDEAVGREEDVHAVYHFLEFALELVCDLIFVFTDIVVCVYIRIFLIFGQRYLEKISKIKLLEQEGEKKQYDADEKDLALDFELFQALFEQERHQKGCHAQNANQLLNKLLVVAISGIFHMLSRIAIFLPLMIQSPKIKERYGNPGKQYEVQGENAEDDEGDEGVDDEDGGAAETDVAQFRDGVVAQQVACFQVQMGCEDEQRHDDHVYDDAIG